MKGVGKVILFVGVCWAVFALNMDVSVSTGSGGRVNNLGLMADRQIHTILGGIIALAGLLMILLTGKTTTSPAAIESNSRPCPMCAETIKNAAVKCKHCGADIAEQKAAESIASDPTSTEPPSEPKSDNTKFWALCVVLGAIIIGGILYRLIPENKPGLQSVMTTYQPMADELVNLNSSAFGCMISADFSKALYHYNQSEFTAWADVTANNHCFHQKDVSPDILWTVLQVREDLMQVGLKQAAEYSKAPELGQYTYWTQTRWASPRK